VKMLITHVYTNEYYGSIKAGILDSWETIRF